jgi:4-hydroxybenzoate polyprenyltransferase
VGSFSTKLLRMLALLSILFVLSWVLLQMEADRKLLAAWFMVGAGFLLMTEAYARRDRKIGQRLLDYNPD